MARVQAAFPFKRPSRGVVSLIVTLFAVWVVGALGVRVSDLVAQVYPELVLVPSSAFGELHLWQVFTYPFVETLQNPTPMLFSLIGLYFFGTELERRWGTPRFFLFLLWVTCGGAALTALAWWAGLGFGQPVAGASTWVIGLLTAWGLIFRDRTIYVFFMLPLRGLHVVWLTLGFQVLSAISLGPASTTSHLGAMGVAYLLTQGLWRTNRWRLMWDELLVRLRIRKAPRLYVVPKQKSGPDRYHIN